MVQIRILLAEDDINLGPILKSYLEQKGYACVLAKDGGAAVDVFTKYDFTLCILDITMPVKDGFETAIENLFNRTHSGRRQIESLLFGSRRLPYKAVLNGRAFDENKCSYKTIEIGTR